jgi:hypothetical protein
VTREGKPTRSRLLLEGTGLLASALILLSLIALLFAGEANFAIGGANPPWIGHRWHPIVVGGVASLVLSIAALVTSAPKRRWFATSIAFMICATVVLATSSIVWHDRAFGTRTYVTDALSRLHLGPEATPIALTYLAGGETGYKTPDSPSGTRSWRISEPVSTACPVLAQAARRWSTDGIISSFSEQPEIDLACHFDVRYGEFYVSFQDVGGSPTGPWTLKAFMETY